jgi:hypothetical protein
VVEGLTTGAGTVVVAVEVACVHAETAKSDTRPLIGLLNLLMECIDRLQM